LRQLNTVGDLQYNYQVLGTSGTSGGIAGVNSIRVKVRAELVGDGHGESAETDGRYDGAAQGGRFRHDAPPQGGGAREASAGSRSAEGSVREQEAESGPYIKLMNNTRDLRVVTFAVASSRRAEHVRVLRGHSLTLRNLPSKGFGVIAFDDQEWRIAAAGFNLRVPFEVSVVGEQGRYELEVNPLE
jgi:hypothetical protein